MASQGNRVVLSGIGGDEVMGGVPTPAPELENLLARAQFCALAHQLKIWALEKRKPWFHLFWEAARGFFPPALVGVQFCEASLGRADWVSLQDEAIGSSTKLPGKCEYTRRLAKATGVQSSAVRAALRKTLSLSGSQLAGVYVCDSPRTTGSTNPTPVPHAPRTRRHRAGGGPKQEDESIRHPVADGSHLKRLGTFCTDDSEHA